MNTGYISADELAKFFQWFMKLTGHGPFSYETRIAIERFKAGHVIMVHKMQNGQKFWRPL